jgi:hypothetical protein
MPILRVQKGLFLPLPPSLKPLLVQRTYPPPPPPTLPQPRGVAGWGGGVAVCLPPGQPRNQLVRGGAVALERAVSAVGG